MNDCPRQNPAYRPTPPFHTFATRFSGLYVSILRGNQENSFFMNTLEIFKRLKIGLSLVVGFLLGKLLASLDMDHYSMLFSVGFLVGAIGTQGVFRLIELWRQNN